MNRVGYVAAALVAALTSLALTGHAFTLGELRGNVIVGRSLDVSVPVQTSAGEDAAASCITAEVYHADVLQPTPSVLVTPVASAAVPTSMVRIQSRMPVDEPVVTLVVRSTCGSPTTRRYVVLADFPTVVLPLAAVEAVPAASQAEAPVTAKPAVRPDAAASEPVASKASVAMPTARAASSGIPAKTVKVAKPTPPKKVLPRQVKPPPPPRPAPERVPGKATLKLDPLELPVTVPSGPLTPASAAASAPVPSEESLLMAKQLAALQDEIKAMRALALKNDASVLELRAQLLQAQSDRVPASWIYLLLALLLASLAAVGWLIWQQRLAKERAATWWQRPQDASTDTVLAPSPVVPLSSARSPVVPATLARQSNPVANGTAQPAAPSAAELNLDIDLDSLHAIDDVEADAQLTQVLEFAPKEVAAIVRHSISIEPILDIRQQAEFFVSLGQTERALRLLKKQIAESSEPNPFVYLDLLELYYSLGLKSEFREYRTAFNQYFNGLVPDFPAFHAAGKDLLAYPEALARLMECWPSSEAMAFMDACIFRDAQATAQPSFDLPAFRDLLMLHAIAETMPTSAPWNATRRASLDAAPDTEILPDAVQADSAPKAATAAQENTSSSLSFAPSDWQIRQAKETLETPSKMLDLDFSTFSPAADNPTEPVEPPKTDSTSPTVPGQF